MLDRDFDRLRSMLSAMRDGEDSDGPCDISNMGKVELLRCFNAAYQHTLSNGCPFKPGDLVTPRRESSTKGAGEPHIVLEVIDPAIRWEGEPGFNGYGRRIDIRVAAWNRVGECFGVHWCESTQFEGWSE